MIKWLWIGGFASVTFALLIVFMMGIDPRAIRIINPSEAKEPEDIGHAIYQRLYLDIRQSPVVILGSSVQIKNYEKIWWGLLGSSSYFGENFDVILEYEKLNSVEYVKGKWRVIKGNWSAPELAKKVDALILEGKKVLIHTDNLESSQFGEGNLQATLKKELKVRPWIISQHHFLVNANQESLLQPSCGENNLLSLFSCKTVEVSKKYYRKKLTSEVTQFVMEKHGQKDFLLFVSGL